MYQRIFSACVRHASGHFAGTADSVHKRNIGGQSFMRRFVRARVGASALFLLVAILCAYPLAAWSQTLPEEALEQVTPAPARNWDISAPGEAGAIQPVQVRPR